MQESNLPDHNAPSDDGIGPGDAARGRADVACPRSYLSAIGADNGLSVAPRGPDELGGDPDQQESRQGVASDAREEAEMIRNILSAMASGLLTFVYLPADRPDLIRLDCALPATTMRVRESNGTPDRARNAMSGAGDTSDPLSRLPG